MYAESFAGLKIAHDEFAGEFEPEGALSGDALEYESAATENSRTQRLLEAQADLNLRSATEESVAVNQIFVPGGNFDGNDVAGKLGGESQFARRPPMARYSVMKMEPPPATRLSTPKRPPPPPNWVCVVI